MKNFKVIELQTFEENDAAIVQGYDDKGSAEGRYLTVREAARQSAVPVHTVMLVDKLGNIIEGKYYVHPVEPEPEDEGDAEQ